LNPKRYIIDEILRACQELGVSATEMDPEAVDLLREELGHSFGAPGALLTFETMKDKASIQDPEAWKRLAEFIGPGPHVLFYDSPGFLDRGGVAISDGARIVEILGESFGFPFYVTDVARTFVVGMNFHDFLIGTGRATRWVKSLTVA
jgi:hypothetical protein